MSREAGDLSGDGFGGFMAGGVCRVDRLSGDHVCHRPFLMMRGKSADRGFCALSPGNLISPIDDAPDRRKLRLRFILSDTVSATLRSLTKVRAEEAALRTGDK